MDTSVAQPGVVINSPTTWRPWASSYPRVWSEMGTTFHSSGLLGWILFHSKVTRVQPAPRAVAASGAA